MRTLRARALILVVLAVGVVSLVFVQDNGTADASPVQRMTDVMTRVSVDTFADHTITFVSPSGIDAPTDSISVTFASQFTMGAFTVANVDFAVDDDSACNGPWTDKTLAASAAADVWGVAQAGNTLTFTPPTNAALGEVAANRCVRVKLGANATVGAAGATQLKNPGVANAYRIDIAGGFGDSGFFWVSVIQQDFVQVTATVPSPTPPTPADTVVRFQGIAYPSSQVTMQRAATILATVPADPQARFDVTVSNQPSGVHTFSVFADDALGRTGRISVFVLSITQGTTTTVSGIFLGPTIAASAASIPLDGTLSILGATAPQSNVTLFVESEEIRTFTTEAGTDGLWVRQLLGTDLGLGEHMARAKAVAPSSEISGFSDTLVLTVGPLTPPDVCDGKNRADLNCDGKVNLVDFSILLFYWKKPAPFANTRVDLNLDGRVDLVDLSILLFNWAP